MANLHIYFFTKKNTITIVIKSKTEKPSHLLVKKLITIIAGIKNIPTKCETP